MTTVSGFSDLTDLTIPGSLRQIDPIFRRWRSEPYGKLISAISAGGSVRVVLCDIWRRVTFPGRCRAR